MAIDRSVRHVHAFTLIELLVVVAILAMLLSILLPSLGNAREQAKAAVCLSRLRNLGLAQQAYQTNHHGYLPGSPLTSGYGLAMRRPAGQPTWMPGDPINSFDYTIPLLREMGVRVPQHGDPAALRRVHFILSTRDAMECPSNQQVAPGWTAVGGSGKIDPDAPKIRAVSYLTMNTIVRGGPAVYAYFSTGPGKTRLAPGVLAWDMAHADRANASYQVSVETPRDYVPRMERVGRPSLKVFLADGTRYVSGDGWIDYDTGYNNFAGYHSAQPPSDYERYDKQDGTAPAQEYTVGRRFAYRHGRGAVINALMLDGHAEPLRALWHGARTAAGPAVDPRHYFPSRSTVVRPQYFWAGTQWKIGALLP